MRIGCNIDLIQNLRCTKLVMSSYIKHSSWDENVMGQVSPEKPMITYLYWSEKKINK